MRPSLDLQDVRDCLGQQRFHGVQLLAPHALDLLDDIRPGRCLVDRLASREAPQQIALSFGPRQDVGFVEIAHRTPFPLLLIVFPSRDGGAGTGPESLRRRRRYLDRRAKRQHDLLCSPLHRWAHRVSHSVSRNAGRHADDGCNCAGDDGDVPRGFTSPLRLLEPQIGLHDILLQLRSSWNNGMTTITTVTRMLATVGEIRWCGPNDL